MVRKYRHGSLIVYVDRSGRYVTFGIIRNTDFMTWEIFWLDGHTTTTYDEPLDDLFANVNDSAHFEIVLI